MSEDKLCVNGHVMNPGVEVCDRCQGKPVDNTPAEEAKPEEVAEEGSEEGKEEGADEAKEGEEKKEGE